MVEQKYGHEIGINFGEWDKQEKVNTEMAVHKWDFTYFMNKDDLKAFKGEKPGKLEAPK